MSDSLCLNAFLNDSRAGRGTGSDASLLCDPVDPGDYNHLGFKYNREMSIPKRNLLMKN
jgi:hypothetical protein